MGRIGLLAMVGACVSTRAVTFSGHAAAAPGNRAASIAPACTAAGDTFSPTDIDADAASDLVVGVPSTPATGPTAGAGAVDIHFEAGLTGPQHVQRFAESMFTGLPAPAYGDGFGSAVAFTHLRPSAGSVDRGDACADL